jgi:hypothetical protein
LIFTPPADAGKGKIANDSSPALATTNPVVTKPASADTLGKKEAIAKNNDAPQIAANELLKK